MKEYLNSTQWINADAVGEKTDEIIAELSSPQEKAAALFIFVRDNITYTPYVDYRQKELYRADRILATESTYCVPKAILLATMARAAGIPSRLRFATIRNHRMPRRLKEALGSDEIHGHGFTELFINERWLTATPAFDKAMSIEQGFTLVEFDGTEDARFHPFDTCGTPHIDYLSYSEPFADFEYDWLMDHFKEQYGEPDFNSLMR